MRTSYPIDLIILALLFLSSCTATKQLSEDEVLYDGTSIELSNKALINNNKKLIAELESSLSPEPNKKLLGLFRLELWLRQHIKEPKKKKNPKEGEENQRKKGIRNWLKYKIGEEAVLMDDVSTKRMSLLLEKKLMDKGYLGANVTFEIEQKNEHVSTITYFITTRGQYFVNNIDLPNEDAQIGEIIWDGRKDMMIKPCTPYNLDNLKAERDRISKLVRNQGYYDFNKEYVYYYIDSSAGNKQVDIFFKVKPPTDSTAHTRYYLRDIYIFPDYALELEKAGVPRDTIHRKGYTVVRATPFIKSGALIRAIELYPDSMFSQKAHDYTINHMLDLGIFKFVNIRYTKVGHDSLDVLIELTPSKNQDVKFEVEASTSNRNLFGSFVSAGYNHYNLLRGAERLRFKVSSGAEFQVNSESLVNIFNFNAVLDLSLPRFVTPFKKINRLPMRRLPSTRFSLREDYQKWVEFYTINSFDAGFGYDWLGRKQTSHSWNVININKVQLINTTSDFDSLLIESPLLATSFEDFLILGTNYTFSISTKDASKPLKNYIYFRSYTETSGNFLYGMYKAFSNEEEPFELINSPFSQFIRSEADIRYYMPINLKQSFVSRLAVGFGEPYGNSEVLPYTKQFFVGGPSSLRAFPFRSLGPGTYNNNESDVNSIDQAGSILLEMNIEYRYTYAGFLKGALFLDAGNVWLRQNDDARPGGQINNKFYRELALGTGLGTRLDFDFFVIRFDIGIPIRKPYLPEGDRWTWNETGFFNRSWRKDNFTYNLAIGYPF